MASRTRAGVVNVIALQLLFSDASAFQVAAALRPITWAMLEVLSSFPKTLTYNIGGDKLATLANRPLMHPAVFAWDAMGMQNCL